MTVTEETTYSGTTTSPEIGWVYWKVIGFGNHGGMVIEVWSEYGHECNYLTWLDCMKLDSKEMEQKAVVQLIKNSIAFFENHRKMEREIPS